MTERAKSPQRNSRCTCLCFELFQLAQHDALHLGLDVLNAAHRAAAGAVDGLPAEVGGTVFGGGTAAGKLLGVFFVDVLFAFVAVVALGHQLLAHSRVHL